MDWWQAVILGLVEGLTEYLPVSSTGHLILAQRMMGIPGGEAADAFAICIQAGAIVAVLGLYWRRVRQMSMGLLGRNPQGLKLLINLVAAFVPAMVFGLLLNKQIKAHLFGLWPIVIAWFIGGIAILAVAKWKGHSKEQRETSNQTGLELTDLTWKLALIIGFAQCIAMWPGTSRSLVTLVAGLAVGMKLAAAVEFAFLLGVMTLGAATCYDGLKHGSVMLESYGILPLGIGFLFAFLSAVVAVKWMVTYLQNHGLQIFGWYRVAIAVVVAVLILAGVLHN
jgi:undecaprenyl-diphosphatase